MPFDPKVFLTKANGGRRNAECRTDQSIFVHGDRAEAIFYIRGGKIRLTESLSISAGNGFGRNRQPSFNTSVPESSPEISSIFVSCGSWFIWIANSIPVISGISISDKSKWMVPVNCCVFGSASFPPAATAFSKENCLTFVDLQSSGSLQSHIP